MKFLQELIGRIEFKVAIKTALAGSLSFLVGYHFGVLFDRPDVLVGGLWTVLAAIVVMQANIGGTYKAAWERFLGVSIGSIAGAFFTAWIGSNALSLGIAIAGTIIICSLFNLKESVRIACMSLAVIMLLWGLKPGVSLGEFSFYRYIDSCLGILIALSVAHAVWPSQATRKLGYNISETLLNFEQLYELVANFQSKREDREIAIKRLSHATDRLLTQNRQFFNESRLELKTTSSDPSDWNALLRYMENTFDHIQALATLHRYNLEEIFDEGLHQAVNHLILQTEITFRELASLIESDKETRPSIDLAQASEDLNEELKRFRTTRTTRQFTLRHVESFFVFFYRIRSIAEELYKIERKILTIKSTSSL